MTVYAVPQISKGVMKDQSSSTRETDVVVIVIVIVVDDDLRLLTHASRLPRVPPPRYFCYVCSFLSYIWCTSSLSGVLLIRHVCTHSCYGKLTLHSEHGQYVYLRKLYTG